MTNENEHKCDKEYWEQYYWHIQNEYFLTLKDFHTKAYQKLINNKKEEIKELEALLKDKNDECVELERLIKNL